MLEEGGAFIAEVFAAFLTSKGPLGVLVEGAAPRDAAGVAEAGVGAEADGVGVVAVGPVDGFLGPPRCRGAGRASSSGCLGWDGPGFSPGGGSWGSAMTAFPLTGRSGQDSGPRRPKWQPRGSTRVREEDGVGVGGRGALGGAPGAAEGVGGRERGGEASSPEQRHLADHTTITLRFKSRAPHHR